MLKKEYQNREVILLNSGNVPYVRFVNLTKEIKIIDRNRSRCCRFYSYPFLGSLLKTYILQKFPTNETVQPFLQRFLEKRRIKNLDLSKTKGISEVK